MLLVFLISFSRVTEALSYSSSATMSMTPRRHARVEWPEVRDTVMVAGCTYMILPPHMW